MAGLQIEDDSGLTDFQDDNNITQFQDDDGDLLGTGLPPNVVGTVLPLFLLMRLRIHAMWLLFVMIPF